MGAGAMPLNGTIKTDDVAIPMNGFDVPPPNPTGYDNYAQSFSKFGLNPGTGPQPLTPQQWQSSGSLSSYNAGASNPQSAPTNALQSFIGSNTNPYSASTSPYFQAANAQAQGNLAGAQQATQANRVNQNTLYGGLQYQQGTDANGNPTWTANQTGTDQTQGLVNSSLAGLQASINNPAYGINPGETYSDAIMRRLQPQMAQSKEMQDAQLANQGIVPGTQAYDNAMRTFNQGQNDLLTSAQIQGMNTGLQAQQLQGTQAGQIKNLTTPNLINAPTQAAVAGPDYMGALGSQTAAQIAANNAAIGQQTANTAGLYGLGSAGILGLAANPGLASSGLTGLGNLVGQGLSSIGYNPYSNMGLSGNFLSGYTYTDPSSVGPFIG